MNALFCATSAGNIALYIGVGAGVVVLIAAAIVIAAFALKRKKNKQEEQTPQRQGRSRFDVARPEEEPAPPQPETLLGESGELLVEQAIGVTQPGKQYVLNNYAAYHEGKTFEVDHIVINPRGIFVLETKNWAGEVFGAEDDEMWKQCHGRGRYAKEDNHPNPIKQNSGHAYHIRQILGGKYEVNPLVVMANDNAGRILSDKIVNLCELAPYLDIFGPTIYSVSEMEQIYDILTEYQMRNGVSHDEHVRTIERNRELVAKGVCPACGGKLVLRRGQNGDFWGCENYPDCKFKTSK